MRAIFLIFFLCLLLLAACRKEKVITKTVEIPQIHSWLLDSNLLYTDKILLTSVRLNDSALGAANGLTLWTVNGNNIKMPVKGLALRSILFFLHPPSLDKKLGVTVIDSTHLRVFSTISPYLDMSSFIYTPPFSRSTTSNKSLPIFYPPS